MSDERFSVLDLLDLPPLERELFLHLARHGPAGPAALAAATGRGEAELRPALAALIRKGRLRMLDDGRAEVVMGYVSRGGASHG